MVDANILSTQYAMVRDSRSALLDYCSSLPSGDFMKENPSFGRGGSMRNLLVHIANTYEYWIIRHGLQKEISFTSYESVSNTLALSALFATIDEEMHIFINRYANSLREPIALTINGSNRNLTALELFTHVLTHEFHHKGQVLSISRQLGHTPVDTDVIR